jgi:hypothetical protein
MWWPSAGCSRVEPQIHVPPSQTPRTSWVIPRVQSAACVQTSHVGERCSLPSTVSLPTTNFPAHVHIAGARFSVNGGSTSSGSAAQVTFREVHHYFDGPVSLPLPPNVLPSRCVRGFVYSWTWW